MTTATRAAAATFGRRVARRLRGRALLLRHDGRRWRIAAAYFEHGRAVAAFKVARAGLTETSAARAVALFDGATASRFQQAPSPQPRPPAKKEQP